MARYSRKDITLNIYYIIFTICIAYQFVNTALFHSKKEYWGITEWLINYQGGFVRRGLRGELVYRVYKLFNIDPYTFITIITVAVFLILIYLLVAGFIKKGFPILLLPFSALLGNPILNNSWMRADSLILLILFAIVFILVKRPRFCLFWINILAILGLLIHEIFIFIAIPFIFLFLFNEYQSKYESSVKSLFYSLFSLLPALIITFLVVLFKGTSHTAHLIWESWKGIPFPDTALVEMSKDNMGAIAGIGLSIKGGMSIPAEFAKCYDIGLYCPIVLLVTLISLYFVLNNINKLDNKILGCKPKPVNTTILSSVLLFQFIVIAPLYIIGDDFSRWMFFWVISSFILLIVIPEEILISIFPFKFQQFAVKTNQLIVSFIGNSKALLMIILILFGIPLYSWNLISTIETSSLYVVLSSISSLIQKIM